MSTTTDLIQYYVDLLIMQFASRQRASGTVGVFVGEAIADQINDQVQNGFDLDTAVGPQLDMLGTYRGVNRQLYGYAPDRIYFEMPFYGETPTPDTGFSVYGQDPILDFWLTYQGSLSPIYTLTDEEERTLIRILSLIDSSRFGLGELDTILFAFFGTNLTLIDNMNMTITYIDLISDTDTLFGIMSVLGALPRPAGVRSQAFRASALSGFFGFQFYDDPTDPDFVGYGTYAAAQDGSFIQYP